ncbi:MAG: porphobilinogen synthase [Bacillota bacterium]
MKIRPRRLRQDRGLRSLVRETQVMPEDLIYPLFIKAGENIRDEIDSLPGCYHLSPDEMLLKEAEKIVESGLKGVILFGLPAAKDEVGSRAKAEDGPVQKACRLLKREYPELYLITDVCLCAYTSHGHCGLVENGEILNDKTLPHLTEMAVSHAESGADMVAPSDMMDGRVAAIRNELDKNDFKDVPIMSYAAKYNSAFYGPFREAQGSSPTDGDRSSHQMDFANSREALREIRLDEEEGADILMVKPALAYLDIIKDVREKTDLPVAAYNVSGEYSLVHAGSQAGLVNRWELQFEILTAIKRAGADLIISYAALEFANRFAEKYRKRDN